MLYVHASLFFCLVVVVVAFVVVVVVGVVVGVVGRSRFCILVATQSLLTGFNLTHAFIAVGFLSFFMVLQRILLLTGGKKK